LDRPTDLQMALMVLALGAALYLPLAGSYGLWDPWETHYAEVARQMTKRSDFISLWWPGSPRETSVFQTKPVLSYWLMSLGMHVAGVGAPGGPPGEMALGTGAEWAVRTPFCLLGALGLLGVYLVAARLAGRRAGLLAALVTGTCPLYALVARQAMTDMAFVGPMTMALALAVLALHDERERELPRRGRGWWSWPHHGLFYGAVGVFLLVTVPQLVVDSTALRVQVPWGGRVVAMYGAVAMLPYWAGVVAFVALAARARFRRPLYLWLAATLVGLGVLGKGLAGLGLPVIVLGTYLAFTGEWRRLRGRQLPYGLLVSLLVVAVVAIPWHHAMYVRHGAAWWNELFGDNHWRRLMLGRHGDRGTFEYFLRELGYGVWPWVALAGAALVAAARGPVEPGRRALLWLGAVWFSTAYALVSLSMTKFHHYILPAIPGLGILVGCFLDDLLNRPSRRLALASALVGIPLLLLVTVDLVASQNASQHFLWLFSYDYVHSPRGRAWPEALDFRPALWALAAAFALATAALAIGRARRAAVGALCVAAVASTFFLLDVFMPGVAPFWSQKAVIARYYRERQGPDERLIAYQMFWRGETFYTKNEIFEGPDEERTVFDYWDDVDARLRDWLARHRGRRQFFVFENAREGHLRSLLPPEAQPTLRIVDRSNNKFVLAVADL
jgi:4-amino-4-deoxy-L-arabinose transferase-like glycosyltransferase